MIQIVWTFEVSEAKRGMFELAYGPGGAWSTLFAKAPGYRGTALLRDTQNPGRYMTVDAWDSEAHQREFLDRHQEEYSTLDAHFRELIDSEVRLGAYKLLAEGTVRPAPGSGRRRSGGSR
jgi:heme-degrading monooxygenase HmoA